MFKLPIDENSCIVQPYFDGGDTYPGYDKYTLAPRHKSVPSGAVKQAWDALTVDLSAKSKTETEITGLDIDISGFTSFRLFSLISKNVRVKIYCNGELVMDECCSGIIERKDSRIVTTQKRIKTLKYEFFNENDRDVCASLFYLGMTKGASETKNTYTSDWEGFFADDPSYEPFDDNFMSKREIESLREKIKSGMYQVQYENAKKAALELMNKEPEKEIKRTVSDYFRASDNIYGLINLAVIGQIDQNHEMLKMACRCALSLGCCEYWCSDPMETAPTVTWHHRSFTECEIAREVSTVISLAGGLLSPHGRNFLYNMIIMKALPRMEADFMTMEYIYHMNQGIAFMSGYVQALTVLAARYPRYERRIDEAEILLEEMLGNAFEEDGTTFEGANYWQYTVMSYLFSVYFLARHRKKSIGEYVGNKLDNTADFGLSLINENGYMITINDNHKGTYSCIISALMYEITKDERWASLFWMRKSAEDAFALAMIGSANVPKSNKGIVKKFSYNPTAGYTQVCRQGIHLFASSGPSNSGHCHQDKGSFVIYKNGDEVIPDFSTVYTDADAGRLQLAESHTLAIPEKDGKVAQQLAGDGINSTVTEAEYKNGIFEWECDNSNVWEALIVKENKRKIVSEKPDEFIVTDKFELTSEMNISFRINLADKNAVKIEPINWTPIDEKYIVLFENNGEITYQHILVSDAALSHNMITKITIL